MKRNVILSILFLFFIIEINAQSESGPALALKWGQNEIDISGELGVDIDTIVIDITIRNVGDQTANIIQISKSGLTPQDFTIVSFPLTIEPNQEGILKIHFKPLNTNTLREVNINIRYNSLSDFNFRINNKKHPIIVWNNPADIEYGTELSSTQLNATVSNGISGDFSYSPRSGTLLQAGNNQKLSVSFRPYDQNLYSVATKTVYINVLKKQSFIKWNTPASIEYGTALDYKQLNAQAYTLNGNDTFLIGGQYNYNPSIGTVLDVGTHQLNVEFIPQVNNYTTSTKYVTLTVTKKTPVLTWNKPRHIPYGTPLGPNQLNATADVPGTFTYNPPAGTVLTMGQHNLMVTFTPTNSNNYKEVSTNVKITVVEPQAPTLQAHRIMMDTAAGYTYEQRFGNKLSISWARGEGDACIVFVCQKDSTLAQPSSDVTYLPDTEFGKGTQIDNTGWYCVYDGTDSSVTITGLKPGKTYRIMVLEYNNIGDLKVYLYNESIYNPRNFTTLPPLDEGADIDIYATNIITLNKDGKNDKFTVGRIDELKDFELIIFNSLGYIVYKAKPYDNSWEATTSDGKQLPTGTYYYIFQKENTIIRGFITVVK